jgi:hypothetical protein
MEDFTGYELMVGDLVVYAVQDKYGNFEGGTSTCMRMGRITKFTPKGRVSIKRVGPANLPGYRRNITSVHPSAVYRHDGEIPEGWY